MDNFAIRVENLSKYYLLNQSLAGSDTLGDFIIELARDVKSLNIFRKTKNKDLFWALKNITFDVQAGEVIGIIGHNGAGKSTLLKILSRITEPSAGRAIINGRVGSLLEVATGFHPELSGRENIFLNGAILGMRRIEIERKFDAIVAFAEIERFLDTPVKRYSSGMYVRLAFAVAAHLEPEIMLIDEVLAVGDAAFQKKCIGKMENVAQEGRTILFVSHNMSAIQRLCDRSIMLDNGHLAAEGKSVDVVSTYLSRFSSVISPLRWTDLNFVPREGIGKIQFKKIYYSSGNRGMNYRAYSNGPIDFFVIINSEINKVVSSISVSIYDEYGSKLINTDTISQGQLIEIKKGDNIIHFSIKKLYLSAGVYNLGLWVANPPGEVFDWIKSGINIEVIDINSLATGIPQDGAVTCEFDISIESEINVPEFAISVD